jgi:hypothetical protein
MRLQFEAGREGLPLTYCNGKVAFPDKRGPKPAIGSTWNCDILGENPRGTVIFLRLISEVDIAAEKAAEQAAKNAAADALEAEAHALQAARAAAQESFRLELEAAPWTTICDRTFQFNGEILELRGSCMREGVYFCAYVEMHLCSFERSYSIQGSEIQMAVRFPGWVEPYYHSSWEIPESASKSELAEQLASKDFNIPEYSQEFSEGYSGRELSAHYLLSGGWTLEKKVVSWTETSYSSGHEYEGALGTKWSPGGETTERYSRTVVVIKSASGKSWREGHSYGVDCIELPEELSQKFKSGVEITGEVRAYLEGLRAAGKAELQAKVQDRSVFEGLRFYSELVEYSAELQARVNAAQKVLDRVIAADMAAIEFAFSSDEERAQVEAAERAAERANQEATNRAEVFNQIPSLVVECADDFDAKVGVIFGDYPVEVESAMKVAGLNRLEVSFVEEAGMKSVYLPKGVLVRASGNVKIATSSARKEKNRVRTGLLGEGSCIAYWDGDARVFECKSGSFRETEESCVWDSSVGVSWESIQDFVMGGLERMIPLK